MQWVCWWRWRPRYARRYGECLCWRYLVGSRRQRDTIARIPAALAKAGIRRCEVEIVVLLAGQYPGGPTMIRVGDLPPGNFPIDW